VLPNRLGEDQLPHAEIPTPLTIEKANEIKGRTLANRACCKQLIGA
jgi:hypothetical protein